MDSVPRYLRYIDKLPSSELDNYHMVKQLGSGGFGNVYEARDGRGRHYALKTKKSTAFQEVSNSERQEVHALRQLKNERNIIRMIDLIRFPNHLCIVMELASITLSDLTRKFDARLSFFEKQTIFLQIYQGLAAIHSINLIHRDIKPANILISISGIVKIADFGISTPSRATGYVQKLNYRVGTAGYMPLEMLMGDKRYDEKVDVWAAGCTVMELFTKSKLFRVRKSIASQVQAISELCGFPTPERWPRVTNLRYYTHYLRAYGHQLKDSRKTYIMNATRDEFATDLLKKIIRLNPDTRLSAGEVIGHEFFHLNRVRRDVKNVLERIGAQHEVSDIDLEMTTPVPEVQKQERRFSRMRAPPCCSVM